MLDPSPALLRKLWGDLYEERGAHPFRLALHTAPNPSCASQRMTLEVRVAPHHRKWRGEVTRIEGKRVGLSVDIPHKALWGAQSEKQFLDSVLENLLLQAREGVAPRLYEADPRIGRPAVVIEKGFEFPLCPLLDPPQLSAPLCLRGNLRPLELMERWAKCHLCATPFSWGEEVYWGGGNLLWVCCSCAHPSTEGPFPGREAILLGGA